MKRQTPPPAQTPPPRRTFAHDPKAAAEASAYFATYTPKAVRWLWLSTTSMPMATTWSTAGIRTSLATSPRP